MDHCPHLRAETPRRPRRDPPAQVTWMVTAAGQDLPSLTRTRRPAGHARPRPSSVGPPEVGHLHRALCPLPKTSDWPRSPAEQSPALSKGKAFSHRPDDGGPELAVLLGFDTIGFIHFKERLSRGDGI